MYRNECGRPDESWPGHTPEFSKGIYHYVLLNTTDSTSSIRCFSGTVDTSLVNSAPGMTGMAGM